MNNNLQETMRPITGSVQLKNGNWYAVLNLYDEAGKRKPKWIPTGLEERGNKRKAEALKQQYITEYENRAKSPSPMKLLFTDFALSWLDSKKGSIEQSTWENYGNVINNHIIPYFKKKKLGIDEVTPKCIRDYYTYKSSGGRLDGKPGGLSYKTLQKHSSVLKLIFDDALILEEVTRNPALAVKLKKNVEDDDEDFSNAVFLNAEEANVVINAFEGEVLQPIVFVCLYYGLRRSDAYVKHTLRKSFPIPFQIVSSLWTKITRSFCVSQRILPDCLDGLSSRFSQFFELLIYCCEIFFAQGTRFSPSQFVEKHTLHMHYSAFRRYPWDNMLQQRLPRQSFAVFTRTYQHETV
jgi:hypothetical protein